MERKPISIYNLKRVTYNQSIYLAEKHLIFTKHTIKLAKNIYINLILLFLFKLFIAAFNSNPRSKIIQLIQI
ncbi:hypothetical protein SAMN05444355_108117 [Flavobacterium frigoris]|uniref:Uncharacterized protein n=1 Tax=Flavobacterium frigoris TaxID=229204 RepID=A0A1H9MJF7_FLAFI|nr:hypothetical protein SAMN05444355_108117 [Flavobacterium frigoris]